MLLIPLLILCSSSRAGADELNRLRFQNSLVIFQFCCRSIFSVQCAVTRLRKTAAKNQYMPVSTWNRVTSASRR